MSANEAAADGNPILATIQDPTLEHRESEALRRLTSIGSQRGLNLEEKAHAILELGSATFDLPLGIVSRIEGDRYELVYAVSPNNQLKPGTSFELEKTYCVHTLAADAPTGFEHAGKSEISDHRCYRAFQLESYLGAPLLVDGERYGTLNFSSPEPRMRRFSANERELVRLFAQWMGFELARERDLQALEQARAKLEQLATTDELTQLLNRRAIFSFGRNELQRARRLDHALSVLVIDADRFKSINDRYGHAVGDSVLEAAARALHSSLREVDGIGRIGGEEFCALLLQTKRAAAAVIAERIRKNIGRVEIPTETGPLTVSVSIGVAELAPGDESFEDLVARADAALYQAKHAGRDRISVAG